MWCARVFISELHSLEWVAILVARVAVGLLFFLSGRAKLFVPERREEMRQTLIKAHVVFSRVQRCFRFDGGVCLRVVACSWRADAAGVCVARGRNDCRHRDDSDSEYQSNLASRVARGISVSA